MFVKFALRMALGFSKTIIDGERHVTKKDHGHICS